MISTNDSEKLQGHVQKHGKKGSKTQHPYYVTIKNNGQCAGKRRRSADRCERPAVKGELYCGYHNKSKLSDSWRRID